VLRTLSVYSSAQALASADVASVEATLRQVSEGQWGAAEAELLQQAARHSAASTRAVAARSLVVRTFAQQILHLQAQIAELEDAIRVLLNEDVDGQRLQQIPGIGPHGAATIRAELGEIIPISLGTLSFAGAQAPQRPHEITGSLRHSRATEAILI
jgi:transposase